MVDLVFKTQLCVYLFPTCWFDARFVGLPKCFICISTSVNSPPASILAEVSLYQRSKLRFEWQFISGVSFL